MQDPFGINTYGEGMPRGERLLHEFSRDWTVFRAKVRFQTRPVKFSVRSGKGRRLRKFLSYRSQLTY